MEPVFYVMAILGCGDASAQCRQVRVEPARYQSVAQCEAAMPGVLERNTDISFPVISAACQQNRQRFVQSDSQDERPTG